LPIPWNSDPPDSGRVLRANLEECALDILAAAAARGAPSVERARIWHRQIYRNVVLPVAYYAGEVRDDDRAFPELVGYEVAVAGHRGVPSVMVPGELVKFERRLQASVRHLDAAIPSGAPPSGAAELQAAITLCAFTHGEWVRIHPFPNGNGRIARLWVRWVGFRYGLPPFLRLQPRPVGTFYASAAAASMQGDHSALVDLFHGMLSERLSMS